MGTVLRWASDVTVLRLNTCITANTIYRGKPNTHIDMLVCRFLFLHSVTVTPEEWSSPAPGTMADWACCLFATVMALFPQFQHVKGDIMHLGFTLTDQQHTEFLYSGGPQGSLFTDRDKHSSALLGFQKFLSVIITLCFFLPSFSPKAQQSPVTVLHPSSVFLSFPHPLSHSLMVMLNWQLSNCFSLACETKHPQHNK